MCTDPAGVDPDWKTAVCRVRRRLHPSVVVVVDHCEQRGSTEDIESFQTSFI